MRFLIFSDLHHMPRGFMGGEEGDIAFFARRAQQTNCDFIIHAGDFCHSPGQYADFVQLYNTLPIPAYHVMGNHDTDETPLEQTLRCYRMPAPYYHFDVQGYRIICTDTNYLLKDGAYFHYELQNYYGNRENRDYMPPEELSWLEDTIRTSPYPCVIISHASFERGPDGVKNQSAVRHIIDRANARKKHSVLLCINGHYHCDHLRILNNVAYLDLNSASYDFLPAPHDRYPSELTGRYAHIAHTLVYNDPLCAVITLEAAAITIDGMESTYLCNISRADTPNALWDDACRLMTPSITSEHFTLL